MSKLESLISDFSKAVERLAEVLRQEKNEFVRDSAIKRFEIVFDLAWKTTKPYLEEKCNVICNSPRTCFREAFHQGLIEYENFWLEITSERNYTAHIYKEQLAEKIYSGLPDVLKRFQKLLEKIKQSLQ